MMRRVAIRLRESDGHGWKYFDCLELFLFIRDILDEVIKTDLLFERIPRGWRPASCLNICILLCTSWS